MKRARRTKLELIIEILKICRDSGTNKSRIVSSSNLNSKIAYDYLEFLIEKGYLTKKTNKYQISKNGIELLNKIEAVAKALSIPEK